MNKASVIGAVALFALAAGAAQAADVSAPQGPNWSGFYVGLTGGYGWGNGSFDGQALAAPEDYSVINYMSDSFPMQGALLGGKVGLDAEVSNNVVIGLVGDVSWTNINGKLCIEGGVGSCDGSPDDSYLNANIDWLGTARGRLGFASGNTLFYGTGGLAFGNVNTNVTNIEGGNDPTRYDSNMHVGWTIGAGAEMKLSEKMSVGAEYLYVDLGSKEYKYLSPDGGADVIGVGSVTANIVRASLNYHF
jgi:outer membrane immunogenic protein